MMSELLMRLEQKSTLHATCVLWQRFGVLITGASGAGKSQLALTMLAQNSPQNLVRLVADDRICIAAMNERLLACAPQRLQGQIERFGSNIETHPFESIVCLNLVVTLMDFDKIERLARHEDLYWQYENIALPQIILPKRPINAVGTIGQAIRQLKK